MAAYILLGVFPLVFLWSIGASYLALTIVVLSGLLINLVMRSKVKIGNDARGTLVIFFMILGVGEVYHPLTEAFEPSWALFLFACLPLSASIFYGLQELAEQVRFWCEKQVA